MTDWISVLLEFPPDGVIVETKIEDQYGTRSQQKLAKIGDSWGHMNGITYVYDAPTHWRPVTKVPD